MASIEQEDVLGMVDLLLPGERETFREPLVDLVGELSRLEVLSSDATLSDLAGLDFDLTDETTSVTLTNVTDIANIRMTGTLSASLDGEQLPIGDVITDLAGEDFDPASLDQPTEVSDFDLPMTVVEEDGRWYLSLFHTLAESIRGDFGDPIPETGLAPRGGDTPEGAVDAMLDGVEQFDVGKIIAAINPNEAQALQRYAPMFLDDLDPVLADIPFSWQVTNTEYDVAGSGSKRSVSITSLRIDGDAEGESFSIVISGGCVVFEGGGERVDTCELQEGLPTVDDVFGDTSEIADITAEFEEVFADYDQPGLTVQQVDGQWFVSPIGSGFDQVLALLRALDRDEIDRLIDTTTRLVDEVAGEFGDFTGFEDLDDLGGLPGIDEDPQLGDPLIDEDPQLGDPLIDEQAVPDDSGDSLGVPPDLDGDVDLDDFEEQQRVAESCNEFADVADVSACLRENVELGVLPSYYYTVELEFPECGVADVSLGRVPLYTMSDQDYTAMIATASICFQALIESGTVEVDAVPPEYLKPSCGNGRNPWNFEREDNDVVFDDWLTCVYE
jgi:hypothetical protein